MNLQYKYWYFEKALPSSFCNDVIKHALAKKDKKKAVLLVSILVKNLLKNNHYILKNIEIQTLFG